MRKALPIALAAALALCAAGSAQSAASGPEAEAAQAIDAREFERAARILIAAEKADPANPRLPLMLGGLYDRNEVFDLADGEYRKAEALGMADAGLWLKLAVVSGKVSKEKDSVAYYEKYLAVRRDDREAMGDLAWMYFKTHRLKEGIDLLEGEGARTGFGRSFDMTLGTLYSELYDYSRAKAYYARAIEEAADEGDANFGAVAMYNLSLLEYTFRAFPASFALTGDSIAAMDRASGHLARGELLAERLDLAGAAREYALAMDKDKTPLSGLSLAEAYRLAGRLDEALALALKARDRADNAWMLNYGIDLPSHRLSLYSLLERIYEGLAARDSSRARFDPFAAAGAWVEARRDEGLAAYYGALRRKAGFEVARSYMAQGNELSANQLFADALDGYPALALPYLEAAMAFEEGKVPGARFKYLAEKGRLLGNLAMVDGAAAGYDPAWERSDRAEAIADAARIAGAAGDLEGEEARAEELFSLLRSLPRLEGIALPITLSTSLPAGMDGATAAWLDRLLERGLDASGFRVHRGASRRYSLTISVGRNAVAFELRDGEAVVAAGSYAGPAEAFGWAEGICAAVQAAAFAAKM